jgi:hypothetical protein
VAEPAAIVTAAGTDRAEEVDDTEADRPPAPAALVRITVHVETPPEVRVDGLHVMLDGAGGAVSVTVKLTDVPPCVAVTRTVVSAGTCAAVAGNVAVVVPCGIVTEAGTVKLPLLLEIPTTVPPEGAGCDAVTVQLLAPGVAMDPGEQLRSDNVTDGPSDNVVDFAAPLAEAVTVADVELEIVPAVAVKLADAAPDATFTNAGTPSRVLVEASARDIPGSGADFVNVTVQVELPPELSADGEQTRSDGSGGACRTSVALRVLPP